MGKNWEKSPITSIKTSKKICPIGYKSIIQSFWNGTQEGCYCSYLNNTITLGKCDRIGLKNGCKNINALPEMNLNIWKGTKIYGKWLIYTPMRLLIRYPHRSGTLLHSTGL